MEGADDEQRCSTNKLFVKAQGWYEMDSSIFIAMELFSFGDLTRTRSSAGAAGRVVGESHHLPGSGRSVPHAQ